MKAVPEFHAYPRNGGVSVDRGPLTYSIALDERTQLTEHVDHWTKKLPSPDIKTEYFAASPWNYALDVSIAPVYRELEWSNEVFTRGKESVETYVKGKIAPNWKARGVGQPGDIPFMPVAGEGEELDIRFVPMCVQRCRVTVFPQLKLN